MFVASKAWMLSVRRIKCSESASRESVTSGSGDGERRSGRRATEGRKRAKCCVMDNCGDRLLTRFMCAARARGGGERRRRNKLFAVKDRRHEPEINLRCEHRRASKLLIIGKRASVFRKDLSLFNPLRPVHGVLLTRARGAVSAFSLIRCGEHYFVGRK